MTRKTGAGGGSRMWLIWRRERPIRGRRWRTVFVASVRATLPEARDTVAAMNHVYAAGSIFHRAVRAHHIAIPAKAAR